MAEQIKFTQLPNVGDLTASAIIALAQAQGGDYASYSASLAQIAELLNKGISYEELPTEAKDILGAITEIYNSGGGGGGSSVTMSDNTEGGVDLTVDDETRTLATEAEVSEVKADLQLLSNPLYAKKMGSLGDSLTYGMNLERNETWGYMIAERNNMTFFNYGINGTPLASTSTKKGMVERYSSMANGLDYITVMGGANDNSDSVPIGENNDTSIYTFKGAINTIIDGLRQKYPSAHIIFMTNFKRYPSTQEKLYVDAMMEVCALKAIPCKNNYEFSGVDFSNANTNVIFENSTAPKHFSKAGNEFISWGIEAFLKSH